MKTIHSPEGVSLLMENLWLRHKAGPGQNANNVFMVELPPLSPEEKAEIRRKDEAAKGIIEDSQEELFGEWILVCMSREDRIDMMQKRHTHFSAVAEEFSTFEEFIKANDEWLAWMGIELSSWDKYLQLYIQLDYTEYEAYYVIPGDNGKLTVSDIIEWQDFCCAISWLNIFTGEEALEEDILTTY